MALYEDVNQAAQSAITQQGHTLGDALGAYGAAQKLSQDKQNFDMQKQQNEVAKAHAFLGQLDSLSRMTPSMQNVALKSLEGTWKQMYPDMSQDFTTSLKEDKDFRAKALQVASGGMKDLYNGGELTPEKAQALNAVPGLNSADLFGYVNKAYESYNHRQVAALMMQNKVEKTDNSDFEKLGEKVNNPTSRSTIGRYQMNLDKVATLRKFDTTLGLKPGEHPPADETMTQKIARYNNANPQDLYEVAKSADQLLSNANQTVYGTDHLMPKDMGVAQAKIEQWIQNKSVPANSGAFIAKFMNMAEREGQYYSQAKQQALEGMTAGYSHLKKKDPGRFQAVVGNAFGTTQAAAAPAGGGQEETINAGGGQPAAGSVTSAIQSAIGHGHSPDDVRAQLKKKGYSDGTISSLFSQAGVKP